MTRIPDGGYVRANDEIGAALPAKFFEESIVSIL
jgi:hypothetical protein